jgi:hypothetical protein
MNIPNVLFISPNRLPRSGSGGWYAASLSAITSVAEGCAVAGSTGGTPERVAGLGGIVHGKGERT